MAEVLLFHHALGRTEGVQALAEDLRAAGHVVHVPDLFEGHVFDDIDAGVAHIQEITSDEVTERGLRAADGLGEDLVVMGISMGVIPAMRLVHRRGGVRGAVLVDACLPDEWAGGPWPATLPVQVHGMDADPFFAGEGDVDAARELVEGADDGELHLYPGDAHLFVDRSWSQHDAGAAELLLERVQRFLDRVG